MNIIDFNFEIRRKRFHLYSLVFPILYLFIPRIAMAIILLFITALTLYLDISRSFNDKIKEAVDRFFGKFLRNEEKSGNFHLSGASYMALGFLLTCAFFPKNLTITSWLILIICDCLAAIIGMQYGTPLFNNKSYIGSFAFFGSAIMISIMTYFYLGYNTSFKIILFSSFCTTLIEFYSKQLKINDNLAIPLTYSFSTVIFALVL